MGMQSVRAKRGMGRESRDSARNVVVRLRLRLWRAAGLRPGGTAEAAVATCAVAETAVPAWAREGAWGTCIR